MHTWIGHRGEIRVARVGNKLYVRPRAGTAAGVEASLEVETGTLRRTFQVRVVRRARDANLDVLVLPLEAQPRIELVTPLLPPVVPAPPLAPEPALRPVEPVPSIAEAIERDTATARALRFELSVQGVAGLGTTALDVPGYAPTNARQPHRVIGVRIAGRRPGAAWGLEANVSGEWAAAPTMHMRGANKLDMSGPWLRADAGLRGRLGTRLMPTFHGAIGLQAHHRDIEPAGMDQLSGGTKGMPFGGVLALGMGLEYRAGDLLLGLELHVRQGVPNDYRSVGWFLSVGFFLDQGE